MFAYVEASVLIWLLDVSECDDSYEGRIYVLCTTAMALCNYFIYVLFIKDLQ